MRGFFAVAVICGSLFGTHARARDIHVAKTGSNSNSGAAGAPYLSITKAATEAMPGDVVTVHQGTYRELVKPARGGTSETARIVYRAAPGEVIRDMLHLSGGEVLKA